MDKEKTENLIGTSFENEVKPNDILERTGGFNTAREQIQRQIFDPSDD